MSRSYPDKSFLSRYAVPIQISRSYPDATPQATPRPNIRIGNQHPDSLIRLFRVESGGPNIGQGLRVEIETLADKRTGTLSAFQ